VQNLNADIIKLLQVPIPKLKEQQKIASCLSSIDELISAQSQKVEALKTHKKGLMQQLFPLDGETIPRLRFPEFRDAGEWEVKKLGDLSQIVRGGSPRPIDDYITANENGLNWLKIADVDKESKYVTSTKEKVLPSALSKTREVNPGDLIMSNSMSFGRPYILKIKSCIHDGWIAVTQIDEQTSRDYLYYLILSPTSQEYFVDNAAGSGVQNLNADIIKLLQVPIPKLKEQQKIADCLSSIDALISANSQKLDTLKTQKKGLMQQLFPAADEVEA
jgi:type I restriction enzyme S subunit